MALKLSTSITADSVKSAPMDGEFRRELSPADTAPTREPSSARMKEEFDLLRNKLDLDIRSLEECYKAFHAADFAGNGGIGKAQVPKLIMKMGGDVRNINVDQVFKALDKDHNDFISFQEFVKAFGQDEPLSERAAAEDCQTHFERISQDMQGRMIRKRRALPDRARLEGVKQSQVITYLEKEIAEASSCMQLPWAILLLVTCTASFVLHWQPGTVYGIDQSIEFDITENANFAFSGNIPYESGRMGHKNLEDVNNIADFWSWLNIGLVPLLYRDALPISEIRDNIVNHCLATGVAKERCTEQYPHLHDGEKDEYLITNYLLGGVRLRQEKDAGVPCDGEFPYARLGRCYDASTPEYTGFTHPHPSEHFKASNKVPVLTELLPTRVSSEHVLNITRALEDRRWITQESKKVDVTFASYHPSKQVVSMTYINFFFSYGGRIWKQITVTSFSVNQWSSYWDYVVDICWLVQVLRILVLEVVSIRQHVKNARTVLAGLEVYFSFWHILEWIGCFYSFFLLIFFSIWATRVGTVVAQIQRADPEIVGSWALEEDRVQFYNAMDEVSLLDFQFRAAFVFYFIVLALRFFKAFAAQPRLSIVTRTIQSAMVDLAHFGVVFVTVFAVFCVTGLVLFGQELASFSSMGRASYACWRMLLGDYDIGPHGTNAWDTMVQTGSWHAGMWYLGFSIMMSFVLLNMLLAVIMDVYTEVKGSIGSGSETLWSQAYEIYCRWNAKRKGRHIDLSDVLLALDPTVDDWDDTEDDPTLKAHDLMKKAPGLSRDQAEDILIGALTLSVASQRDGASLSDAMNKIESTEAIVADMHERVEELVLLLTVMSQAHMQEIQAAGSSMKGEFAKMLVGQKSPRSPRSAGADSPHWKRDVKPEAVDRQGSKLKASALPQEAVDVGSGQDAPLEPPAPPVVDAAIPRISQVDVVATEATSHPSGVIGPPAPRQAAAVTFAQTNSDASLGSVIPLREQSGPRFIGERDPSAEFGSKNPAVFIGGSNGTSALPHELPRQRSSRLLMTQTKILSKPVRDIVQFSSSVYYCIEGKDTAVTVEVVRIGDASEPLEVDFTTRDGSAKAKKKYVADSGTVYFRSGESRKEIAVQLLQDDSFDATLEFGIVLTAARGADLGAYLYRCNVYISDDDFFPTNGMKEDLERHNMRVSKVLRWKLLREYLRMLARDRNLLWCLCKVICIDQVNILKNVWRIFLLSYLIDGVLSAKGEDEAESAPVFVLVNSLRPSAKQEVAANPMSAVAVVAILWVVPFVVNFLLSQLRIRQRVRGKAIAQVQANLMRKYLHYDDVARNSVSEADLTMAIVRDVPQLIDSLLHGLFDLLQTIGLLMSYTIMAFIQMSDMPIWKSLVLYLTFPTFGFTFVLARQPGMYILQRELFKCETEIAAFTQTVTSCYRVIADYFQRPHIVTTFGGKVAACNTAYTNLKLWDAVTDDFAPFLTAVVCATFITLASPDVLNGSIGIGAVVTGIVIWDGIGAAFARAWKNVDEIQSSVGPLQNITHYMNLPTDLPRRAALHDRLLSEARRRAYKAGNSIYALDELPIVFDRVSFSYPKRTGGRVQVLDRVSVEVLQGQLVAVMGQAGSGKATFLQMFGGVLLPTTENGVPYDFFIPPHLRVLHVGQRPYILHCFDLLENLTFGPSDGADEELGRVICICRRLGISEPVLTALIRLGEEWSLSPKKKAIGEEHIADDELEGTVNAAATKHLQLLEMCEAQISNSDLVLLNLARALVMNPEVLVLHQPCAGFGDIHARRVLSVLKEFVDNRGIEKPKETLRSRRPRTCIYSVSHAWMAEPADMVLAIEGGRIQEVNADANEMFLRSVWNLFHSLDRNKDNRVTREEFVQGMQDVPDEFRELLGLNAEDFAHPIGEFTRLMHMIFSEVDVTGCGDVDFDEFLRYVRKRSSALVLDPFPEKSQTDSTVWNSEKNWWASEVPFEPPPPRATQSERGRPSGVFPFDMKGHHHSMLNGRA